jgi:hypothetical protein
MTRPGRVSLGGLLVAVIAAGAMIATIVRPADVAISVSRMALSVFFVAAALGVWLRRGRARAVWAGVLFFGSAWLILLLALTTSPAARSVLYDALGRAIEPGFRPILSDLHVNRAILTPWQRSQIDLAIARREHEARQRLRQFLPEAAILMAIPISLLGGLVMVCLWILGKPKPRQEATS